MASKGHKNAYLRISRYICYIEGSLAINLIHHLGEDVDRIVTSQVGRRQPTQRKSHIDSVDGYHSELFVPQRESLCVK